MKAVCVLGNDRRAQGLMLGLALENGGMEDNKRRHVEANQEEIEEYF
jgi:hypothetical protein